MLSAAGLSAGASSKHTATTFLAPPPGGARKLRSPLPPPPNDPATARMTLGHNSGLNPPKDSARRPGDSLQDLSSIEVSLPSSVLFNALVPLFVEAEHDGFNLMW